MNMESAIKKYYENPNYCLYCQNIIEIGTQTPAITRKKKFCNKTCANTYNNYGKHRGISSGKCFTCGTTIEFRKNKQGGYIKLKYCDTCKSNYV